jgi:hypothetical protein
MSITEACPACETVCLPLDSCVSASCTYLCEAPVCEWVCEKPAHCPEPTCALDGYAPLCGVRPRCELQCEHPACEGVISGMTSLAPAALLVIVACLIFA